MVYLHVNPFRALKLRKTSILMNLQIISAESDKIYRSQIRILVCQAGFVENIFFSQLAFVYILRGRLQSGKWKQHTRSGIVVA